MTHINAYFSDVEDAKEALAAAKAHLAETQQRLEAKKVEDGWNEPATPQKEETPEETTEPAPAEESKPASKKK